jgi:hypothetical protein
MVGRAAGWADANRASVAAMAFSKKAARVSLDWASVPECPLGRYFFAFLACRFSFSVF